MTEEERTWLHEHPVIRVAQDPGWPPIEFADDRGKPTGIAEDYLRIIERRLGVRLERVGGLSWQESFARLKRWDLDMTTSVAATPERAAFWAFTKPYLEVPVVILTRSEIPYVAGMRELAGKRVAVVEGYIAAELIARDFPKISLVKVGSVREGLDLLRQDGVFAFVDNMLVTGHYLTKMKWADIKIAGETPYVNAQSMAVRKDWPILAGILQKALDSISETERAAIYQKWVPIRYEYAFSLRRLWLPLAAFALLLAGLIAWNRILLREIRTRKGAERALKASEERFKAVMDNLPIGIAVNSVDPVVAFEYMNDNFPRFYRTTRKALARPDAFWDAVYEDPEFREKIRREVLEATSSGDPARMHWDDVPIARRGEPTTYIMAKNTPLPDQGLMISTVWDVTGRKKAEEAVRRADESLRRFVEASVVGVVIADTKGRILEANDYYLKTIGYSREECMRGLVDWRALTPTEWLPADERAIAELRELGTCTPYEKEYARRDGTRVSVFLSDVMIPGPEEQIVAFVLDISERKRAEAELIQKMEELQRFHEMTVGREARMIDLKKEINALLKESGRREKYRIVE